MAQPRLTLLFGIDFGTTYSGVAWGVAGRDEDSSVIIHWDGNEGRRSSSKVPTQISYQGSTPKWGFNIPEGEKPLRFFKLLLLNDDDLKKNMVPDLSDGSYIKETKQMLDRLNKTAMDVVTDYLRLLWLHALKAAKKVRGNGVVDGANIHVVITVPAIWPAYAQSRMRLAAHSAGITERTSYGAETKLEFCAEPEAAALAVMHDTGGRPVLDGDCFVICDVGGGTADLISYQLEDTIDWKLAECATGAGKLCGAVFIDEAFDKVIPHWIGRKAWMQFDRIEKATWIETYWERQLKRDFEGTEKELRLMVPAHLTGVQGFSLKGIFKNKKNSRPPLKGHQLRLKRDVVASIFDPCVNQIVDLVDAQVKRTHQRRQAYPKAVILVGGFGQSPYLFESIKSAVGPSGVEVRISNENQGWTAICRGALIRASIRHNNLSSGNMRREQADISSYVVRTSYGMTFMEEVKPSRHTAEDIEFDATMGREMATNQMDWYIRKNGNLRSQRAPIIKNWSRRVKFLQGNRFVVELYECDLDNTPSRLTGNVREVGRIICQINRPFDQLVASTNARGETFRDVPFDVEMTALGTILEFTAIFDGQRGSPLQITPPFASAEREQTAPLTPPTPSRSPPRRPYQIGHVSDITEPESEQNQIYEVGGSSQSPRSRSLLTYRPPLPPPPVNRIGGNPIDSFDDDP